MTLALESAHETQAARASPFLKWAGGKRQLLPQIRRFYPPTFTEYAEPFLGSGAVFFDLASRGLLDGKRVLLMDSNPDLIASYAAVRDNVDQVLAHLRRLAEGHRSEGSRFYYGVRDERFNPIRRSLARERASGTSESAELAAMMIYLNRTCFNGLFRLNAKGDFNTPAGRYTNPTICDEANLRNVSVVLQTLGVELRLGDFSAISDLAAPGAFVYFDPPYAPLSRTANFTSYTASGFSDAQQGQLRDLVVTLAERSSHVLLSNSVAPLTTRLYETSRKARRAGLRPYRVPARRAINCDGSSRGSVDEYLVSNVDPVEMDGR
ncbi:MAG: DNA adenine methylase [Acidobacteria bacterium]|nr:DNA adenine methylase [Acidobacteriota bacterium]